MGNLGNPSRSFDSSRINTTPGTNRLRSVLGKGSHLFGTRTCTNSSSLTGVKWRDFYQLRLIMSYENQQLHIRYRAYYSVLV